MEKKSAYLRFCCFLTGLSYPLTRISSEQSAKNAKKYMGALLIIMLVWFFIGFCFATRYLHMGIIGGVLGGVLMSFIILQIERIIILSHHISWGGKLFRIILGLVMAILGAMIMDQFTFQDDIELRRAQVLDERVKEAIKVSEHDIRAQVTEVDSMISEASARYDQVLREIGDKPFVNVYVTEQVIIRDSAGNQTGTTNKITSQQVPHPKSGELDKLTKQIEGLTTKRFEVLSSLDTIRKTKEKELKNATGFLDELTLLKEVIFSSWLGGFVYFLFLFFFLSLELFILIMKMSDKESDYDKLVDHQMNVRIQMLQRLEA